MQLRVIPNYKILKERYLPRNIKSFEMYDTLTFFSDKFRLDFVYMGFMKCFAIFDKTEYKGVILEENLYKCLETLVNNNRCLLGFENDRFVYNLKKHSTSDKNKWLREVFMYEC